MKKFLSAFLALAMLAALCACAPAEQENYSLSESTSEAESASEPESGEESEAAKEEFELDPVSEEIAEHRQKILWILEHYPTLCDWISTIPEPVEFVYNENSSDGVPKVIYEFIYNYYNAFVTYQIPDFSGITNSENIENELRYNVQERLLNYFSMDSFSADVKMLRTEKVDSERKIYEIKCDITSDALQHTETAYIFFSLIKESEWKIESVYFDDRGQESREKEAREAIKKAEALFPEFKDDIEKITSAAIAERMLEQFDVEEELAKVKDRIGKYMDYTEEGYEIFEQHMLSYGWKEARTILEDGEMVIMMMQPRYWE